MKLLRNGLLLGTTLFTLNAPLSFGADPIFEMPFTHISSEYVDVAQRAENALRQYAHDCTTNVGPSSVSMTENAVIEYVTDKAGVFLTRDAASLDSCWEGALRLTRAVNSQVRLYPTSYTNTVFIQFATDEVAGATHQHGAIIQMDGTRISRIRDLTTVKSFS
jgi:hypothetical protein